MYLARSSAISDVYVCIRHLQRGPFGQQAAQQEGQEVPPSRGDAPPRPLPGPRQQPPQLVPHRPRLCTRTVQPRSLQNIAARQINHVEGALRVTSRLDRLRHCACNQTDVTRGHTSAYCHGESDPTGS